MRWRLKNAKLERDHIIYPRLYSNNQYCCSVTKLCLTLWPHELCSMPGFPVLHYLPELAQTHVHWVGDAIQPFYPLSFPFSSHPQSFPASGSFPMNQLFTSGDQTVGSSASVLPMSIQGWFPLVLTGLISLQSKGLSGVSSPLFKSVSSSVLSLLYGPTLISVYDYWKNCSFGYTDLCQQSDVSAF